MRNRVHFHSLRKMMDLKACFIIFIIIALTYSNGQSQCDSGYCDEQIQCDLGYCCDNRCVDPRSPTLQTQNKGDNCSSCKTCKDNLCCEKGVCTDACGTTKGEYKCGCTNSTDCTPFYITGVPYECVQGQCLPTSYHMDECIDDTQCSQILDGRLKCLDDPKTNKKRCMVGASLGEACTAYGGRHDVCDPTVDGVWSYCFNNTCTSLPGEGEACHVSLFNDFPCADPWLTCIRGVCARHFSVPLGGDCDGPTQCELPLICNSTRKNWMFEWQYSNGSCAIPTYDIPCKQVGNNCELQIQKCGCKDESPICVSKPVSNQCNSAYKALELCGTTLTQCLPPFKSAFGWLSREGPDSCLQETCKDQLLEFYCCYSCDSEILKGLKCYETPRTFEELNCCAGDVECYVTKAKERAAQKNYCLNTTDINVIIPPLPEGSTPGSSGLDPGINYNALITTIGLMIGLAIGALFFGLYYWRKKAEYEQIRAWQEDSSNPQATQMQPVGISIGN